MIQYSEEGCFIDFIEREDLLHVLEDRIATGNRVLMSGTSEEMAAWLHYFHGKHDIMTWINAIHKRLTNLDTRITKLRSKL